MDPYFLAALARERRRAVEADFVRADLFGMWLRMLTARVLRAMGEGIFRLGVALDERVLATPVAETRN